MQYSPKNAIPYVAMVDAGTVEQVRGSGVKVVSSADRCRNTKPAGAMNSLRLISLRARPLDRIVRGAFQHAASNSLRIQTQVGIRNGLFFANIHAAC